MKWFLLLFIGLFILWLLTGGPERVDQADKPFLREPQGQELGEPIKTLQD